MADKGYLVIVTVGKQETVDQIAKLLRKERTGTEGIIGTSEGQEKDETESEEETRSAEKTSSVNERGSVNEMGIVSMALDVTDEAMVREVAEQGDRRFGKLDVLINNATKKSGYGRIVDVSSGSRSYGAEPSQSLEGSYFCLPSFKAGTERFYVKAANDLKKDHILVNAVTPGMTATYDILAANGGRPVSEGAKSIVQAASLPKGAPTGQFFMDGNVINRQIKPINDGIFSQIIRHPTTHRQDRSRTF